MYIKYRESTESISVAIPNLQFNKQYTHTTDFDFESQFHIFVLANLFMWIFYFAKY